MRKGQNGNIRYYPPATADCSFQKIRRKLGIKGLKRDRVRWNKNTQLTSVNAFVDFEVFRACKDLATAREWARERLLPGVDPDVVDQLVLCLEGTSLSRAVLPVASVVGDLRATNMFHSDVGDDFMKGAEDFVARLLHQRIVGINPEAGHFLLDGVAHISKKRTRRVMSSHAHSIHIGCWIHLIRCRCTAHLVPGPVGRHPSEPSTGHALHRVM